MPTKIVYQAPGAKPHTVGCTLVAGLEWRVLAASNDAALREMAKERAATHAVRIRLSQQPQRGVAGFYVNLDGPPPGAKTHSVAAAFAGWMAQHPVALLCYAMATGAPTDTSPFQSAGAWLVVVVVAGMPVVDALVASWDEAHTLVAPFLEAHPDLSVVSNDAVRYPQTIKADNILPALDV